MGYHRHFSTRQTPQSQPIPGSTQVANSAGGYSWAVDQWKQLDRFLILGAEGGTYYITEQKLTIENANAVLACIKSDGARAVARIVEISDAGRAPKNNPALFALAMASALGDRKTRSLAYESLPKVVRIGTHLFQFLTYRQAFGGWSAGLRRAVSRWYNDRNADSLAYQMVKYRQRDGWEHRDVLRLSHPKPATDTHNALYRWATKDEAAGVPRLVEGFLLAEKAENEKAIINLITDYKLTWEMVPTQYLGSARVWDALLPNLPLTATIRNLGRMTTNGLLAPMSDAVRAVVAKVTDQDYITKSRIHPLNVLVALRTYTKGSGFRGSLAWKPVGQITDALDEAFYLSFGNVTPTGKRLMLGIDVSGSMTSLINNLPITCREAAAAMAMVTARTERDYVFLGFAHKLVQLNITPRQRLDDVIRTVYRSDFGGTDCALPMLAALEIKMPIDGFLVYTDNETWFGRIHPTQALNEYRNKMNIPARLAVVAMTANRFSIADPNDAGMLDVAGFDTATPQVISDFVAGNI